MSPDLSIAAEPIQRCVASGEYVPCCTTEGDVPVTSLSSTQRGAARSAPVASTVPLTTIIT